jgi:hypothetical protein
MVPSLCCKIWTKEKRHDVRLRERNEMVQERGRGEDSMHRNRRDLAAALRSSGEGFAQPGGEFTRGSRGETERRGRATYRHWEESKRARLKAGFIVERVYCTGVIPA